MNKFKIFLVVTFCIVSFSSEKTQGMDEKNSTSGSETPHMKQVNSMKEEEWKIYKHKYSYRDLKKYKDVSLWEYGNQEGEIILRYENVKNWFMEQARKQFGNVQFNPEGFNFSHSPHYSQKGKISIECTCQYK